MNRAINRGFGDGMSRAFELVATPLLFAGLGYLVDRAVGTTPVFSIVLGLFAVAGVFARMWYGYDAEMRAHETSGAWVRGGERPARPAADGSVDLWATREDVR